MLAAQSPEGEAVRIERLERGLLLANDLSGVRVKGGLKSGDAKGESRVQVVASNTARFTGQLGYSNAGARAVGSDQLSGKLNLNSPLRMGDLASLQLMGSRGVRYVRADYRVPLGYDGWLASFNASAMRYKLVDDFASLSTEGEASTYEVRVSYPLRYTRESSVTLDLGYAHKSFENRANGTEVSDKQVDVLGLGLSSTLRDSWLGGGLNSFDIKLKAGSLDLGGNINDLQVDAGTARRQGDYLVTRISASRRQALGDLGMLSLRLSGQLASKNLDSSEQFSLGGSYGVRAYPTGEGRGDQGWLISLEWQKPLNDEWQVSLFGDMGGVQQNRKTWAGWHTGSTASNHYQLQGVGTGLQWSAGNWNASATLAWRIDDNPARDASGLDGDGTRKIPRLWLQLGGNF
jgi:hemolysin activation/secretion protein